MQPLGWVFFLPSYPHPPPPSTRLLLPPFYSPPLFLSQKEMDPKLRSQVAPLPPLLMVYLPPLTHEANSSSGGGAAPMATEHR